MGQVINLPCTPAHPPCMHPACTLGSSAHNLPLHLRMGQAGRAQGCVQGTCTTGLACGVGVPERALACCSMHVCIHACDSGALALHAVPKRHILEHHASVVPSRPFGAEGPVAALNPGARAPASSSAPWRGAGGPPHPCTPYFIPAPPA